MVASKAGQQCPRCGGSMFKSEEDNEFNCLNCGHVATNLVPIQKEKFAQEPSSSNWSDRRPHRTDRRYHRRMY